MLGFNSDNSYVNKFKSSYFQGYVDISNGGVILRSNSDLYFETGSNPTTSISLYTQTQLTNSISNYISYYNLYNNYISQLLTISSNLNNYVNTLNITNTTKKNVNL